MDSAKRSGSHLERGHHFLAIKDVDVFLLDHHVYPLPAQMGDYEVSVHPKRKFGLDK